ncbi:hypothetical protein H0H93_013411 [Arthromyces matolae]|nr:hypothetical protein H0H93_013411 [Arthromyces matolae]
MSTRTPAKALTTSTRRRAISRGQCSPKSPSRTRTTTGDEARISRSAPTISIPLLREAIGALDTKMATLMSQRHELETHLEQAVRLQSPVLRLPSELLSSIFVMGVFEIGDEDPVMVSTLMLVWCVFFIILNTAAVEIEISKSRSRYWAEVALNTPTLWTRLTVSPYDSLEKTRRKIERSKSCLLDVSINFDPRMEYTRSITEHVIDAMELIRPVLWRTKSFRLSVPNRPQAHAALSRCQEDAPFLENLSIHIHHSMQDDNYSSPLLPLFKGHTPRLRSCSLTSFNFGWDNKLVSNLRVLKLGGYFNSFTPSASILLNVFRQCPGLEELALRNISSVDADTCRSDDLATPSKLIQLCRLTNISFYYSGIGLTRQIMSHIAVPNLNSLELCYLENVTPVIHLLHTQAPGRLPLQHLRIESCLLNEIKFVNFLRRVPSLVSLQLIDVDNTSTGFLKGLSSSQPWICPRLEVLSVDGCTDFDWDALRSLVESRLPAIPIHPPCPSQTLVRTRSDKRALCQNDQSPSTPRRLRHIDVTRCTQISKEMIQWLRMYVADVKCGPAKVSWG